MAKRPLILDPKHPAAQSPVAGYKAGIAARADEQRKRQQQASQMPDLTAAQHQYKPGDGPSMTLGQMAQAQRSLSGPTSGQEPTMGRGLRPETIAGLQALQNALQQQPQPQSPMPNQPQFPPAPPGMPIAPQAPAPGPAVQPAQASTQQTPPGAPPQLRQIEPGAGGAPPPASPEGAVDKKGQVADALSSLDDLEFERLLRGVQRDAINNEKERQAVKARVEPIDLIAGIANGEFTQIVPVVPNALIVHYRSITADESTKLRLLLFNMVEKDKRVENVAADVLALMQVVCAITRINGNTLPSHMPNTAAGVPEFDEEAFNSKFKYFRRMPVALVHALGTHGYWFEQRVRDLFATVNETLGNG